MDVLSPFFYLVFRSLVVLLPLTIGWLAFRRLAMSKTGNAWIYAMTCLFATVIAAGILPWALGLTGANWIFLVLAAFCPAVWVGVITLCDMSRRTNYGPDPMAKSAQTIATTARRRLAPLILEQPDFPNAPMPVFRHGGTAEDATDRSDGVDREAQKRKRPPEATPSPSPATRSLMSIAREIRGNKSSESRRPKLLPPPEPGTPPELPFIKRGEA